MPWKFTSCIRSHGSNKTFLDGGLTKCIGMSTNLCIVNVNINRLVTYKLKDLASFCLYAQFWIDRWLLNHAHVGTGQCAPGFLKLLWFARQYVCVCVSTPKPLITSGVIWCDIDHVWLVKQFLWLFLFPVALYDTFLW